MKFGKYLERHQVSEWRKKYVYYKLFKKQIKAIKKALNDDQNWTGTIRRRFKSTGEDKLKEISGLQELQKQQQQQTIPNQHVVDDILFNNNEGDNPEGPGSPPNITSPRKRLNYEREQKKFEQMVQDEFDKVNTFYREQESEFLKQFYNIKEKLLNLPSSRKGHHRGNSNSDSNAGGSNVGGSNGDSSHDDISTPRSNGLDKSTTHIDIRKTFSIFRRPNRNSGSFRKNTSSPSLTDLDTPPKSSSPLSSTNENNEINDINNNNSNSNTTTTSTTSTTTNNNNNQNGEERMILDGGSNTSSPSIQHIDPKKRVHINLLQTVDLENNRVMNPSTPLTAQKVIEHASKAETYWPKVKYVKVKRALKRALEENYREIEVLKEYVNLNQTAFRKIFKKYDKVLQTNTSRENMDIVSKQYFFQSKKINQIEHEIESLYTNVFKPGNRRDAMSKLRVPLDYHAPPRIIFSTGLMTGAAIMLFIFCIRYMIGNVSIFYFDSAYPVDFLSMFILFRCVSLPILMVWYFGILMYVCSIKKINHVLILGWDPRTHTNHYHILLLASGLSFLWAIALYLYVYLGTHIPGYIPILFPFLLVAIIVLMLACPFNILNRSSRFWLLHTFGRIFRAPFLTVKFKDFFLGDQLTSLSVVISDLEYILCYFVSDLWTHEGKCWKMNPITRPCLLTVPYILRALQSIRRYRDSGQKIHMMNFGKYSMSILSIISSALAHSTLTTGGGKIALTTIWIFIASISTLYSLSWDFLMDWGLLNQHSKNWLLRDHLLYRYKSIYYWAMAINITLRVSWAVNISFESYSSRQKELINLITSMLEVTRRGIWNFFRLENEHLSNVGKFRAFDLKIPELFVEQEKKNEDLVIPLFTASPNINGNNDSSTSKRHSITHEEIEMSNMTPPSSESQSKSPMVERNIQ